MKKLTHVRGLRGAVLFMLAAGLAALAWLLMPAQAQAARPECAMGLKLLPNLPAIDGSLGNDWNDATILQTGTSAPLNAPATTQPSGSCMSPFLLDDGASPPAGNHIFPDKLGRVRVFTKRSNNDLYLAFDVDDATQPKNGVGERIILLIDPDKSGGNGLGSGGNSDFRVDVLHLWNVSNVVTTYYRSGGTSFGCAGQEWQSQGNPAGLQTGFGVRSSGYVVEIKIPLGSIGNPQADIGIAFAVVNDLNHVVSSASDATGVSFPNALKLSNGAAARLIEPNDPTGNCDWEKPANWGTGYFNLDVVPGSVTIQNYNSPVWWSSKDLSAFSCNSEGLIGNYEYYPTKPCKVRLAATVNNAAGRAQVRNLLFVWAEDGSNPSVWHYVSLVEKVTLNPGNSTIFTPPWPDDISIIAGKAGHPCVRVYILPETLNGAFDKARMENMSSNQDLNDLHTAYSIGATSGGSPTWTQKNISRNTSGGGCPYDNKCPISRAVKTMAREAVFQDQNPTEPIQREIAMNILLSDQEFDVLGKDNAIVQVRTIGYEKPPDGSKLPYFFIEEFGGAIRLFPIDLLKENGKIEFQLDITNPPEPEVEIAREIFPRIDTFVHPEYGIGVAVNIDVEGGNVFKPGETRVAKGVVFIDTSNQEPTKEPTQAATEEATTAPTLEPTKEATEEVTQEPTSESTTEPTTEPSITPTATRPLPPIPGCRATPARAGAEGMIDVAKDGLPDLTLFVVPALAVFTRRVVRRIRAKSKRA